jgi:hypothetical protein
MFILLPKWDSTSCARSLCSRYYSQPLHSAKRRQALKSIHKIYIEKMPNDLDQYLRAEVFKQFKGKVSDVLTKEEADGIITGVNEEQKGTAAKITGRYLGQHDTVNGTIFPARQNGEHNLVV